MSSNRAVAATRGQVIDSVHGLGVAYEALNAQWTRPLALSAHERQALDHLVHAGPLTMGELGRRIPLSPAATTSLADRLERLGYAHRSADPADRRRTLLAATPRYRQHVAPRTTEFEADLRALCHHLTKPQREAVMAFLQQARELAHHHAGRLRDDGSVAARARRPGQPLDSASPE